MKKSGLLLLASCTSSFAFQQVATFNNRLQNVVLPKGSNSRIPSAQYMQPFESDEVKGRSLRLGKIDTPYKGGSSDKRVPRTELLASTLDSAENIDTSLLPGRFEIPSIGPKTMEAATKVLSASLLIIGNTVGSSMFVLPDAVSGVGLLNGSAIFIGKKIIA